MTKLSRYVALATALALSTATAEGIAQEEASECSIGAESGFDLMEDSLFVLDGVSVGEDDLPAAQQQALFDAKLQFYKQQLAIIDSAVLDMELSRRAGASGESTRKVAEQLFSGPPPDEAAIQAFYDANKARIPYPLAGVRDQISQALVEQQMQTKRASFTQLAKQDRVFELTLLKPRAPYAELVTDGFPSKGPTGAKVTIVEFADYQCPHCQRAAGALKRGAARYPDDVRIVFMDFPINPSGISRVVAEGAACADRQDSFWRYHDLAFERQGALTLDSPRKLATDLKLDLEAFDACVKSEFPGERVVKSETEAKRLGLNSTPTIFLNGRRLHMHDIENEIAKEIEAALASTQG